MRLHFKLFCLFGLFICCNLYSQQRKDKILLEKQKIETVKQIKVTQGLLDQARQTKNISVQQLNLLNINIKNRENLIKTFENEITSIERSIEKNKDQIFELEVNLIRLKEEYKNLIISVYKNLDCDFYLEYILGANDINQSYQRIKEIKYINDYRRKVYNSLIKSIQELEKENINLDNLKKEKLEILNEKEKELLTLANNRNQRKSKLEKLRAEEDRLIREIREKTVIQNKLESEIRKLVEENTNKLKGSNLAVLTPAEKIIANDFYKSKGGLPWPVNQGVITGHYGENEHPVLKGVKTKNIGIDISTVEGEKAKAIFDGEVTRIIAILGANYTVIIKHGEYRTVYQNLANVLVKTGDKIKRGDYLGTIFTDDSKSTKLHFQIWQDKYNIDPENWLAKNN